VKRLTLHVNVIFEERPTFIPEWVKEPDPEPIPTEIPPEALEDEFVEPYEEETEERHEGTEKASSEEEVKDGESQSSEEQVSEGPPEDVFVNGKKIWVPRVESQWEEDIGKVPRIVILFMNDDKYNEIFDGMKDEEKWTSHPKDHVIVSFTEEGVARLQERLPDCLFQAEKVDDNIVAPKLVLHEITNAYEFKPNVPLVCLYDELYTDEAQLHPKQINGGYAYKITYLPKE
jgi:hypothetical protein